MTLRMDHAKLLDVLTSLPVSQSILPRAVYFATSRPANHAICSFIDSSVYASGPIRRCLFIDYIIKQDIHFLLILFVYNLLSHFDDIFRVFANGQYQTRMGFLLISLVLCECNPKLKVYICEFLVWARVVN